MGRRRLPSSLLWLAWQLERCWLHSGCSVGVCLFDYAGRLGRGILAGSSADLVELLLPPGL
jgi:hypothetical protein